MFKDDKLIRANLIKALSRSPVLRALGKSHPDAIQFRHWLERSEVVCYDPGSIIIQEGDKSDRMYFLADGAVEVTIQGRMIATLSQPGDVFGEIGPLTGDVRSATVRAVTIVVCLATDAGFAEYISHNRNSHFMQLVQQTLTKLVAERLQHSSHELAQTKTQLDEAHLTVERLAAKNTELEEKLSPGTRRSEPFSGIPYIKRGR